MFSSPVTILVGHFGSGKTEIALNGVLDLAARGLDVTLADMDIVKPYFRSRAAREMLAEAGVDLLAPTGENIFADLPIIVPQIRTLVQSTNRRAVLDVGGDGTGARVLGSLIDVIPDSGVDVLLVLNFSRPSTPDVEHAVRMVHEIEATSQQRVTGLISNTHLMQETTLDVVRDGAEKALETARRLNLPVVAAAVHEDIAAALDGTLPCPVFILRRLVTPFELPERRATGPLFVVN